MRLPTPARFDRGLGRVLCARLRCTEALAALMVPRGGLLNAAVAGRYRQARVQMSVEYRPDVDGVWRLTAHAARQRRALAAGDTPLLRDLDPARKRRYASRGGRRGSDRPSPPSRLIGGPGEPMGDGADMGRLRREPPLPLVIECPRCGTVSEVTRPMLVAVYRDAVGRIAAKRAGHPGSPGQRPFSLDVHEDSASPKRNKGHHRGGRGRSEV